MKATVKLVFKDHLEDRCKIKETYSQICLQKSPKRMTKKWSLKADGLSSIMKRNFESVEN